MSSPTVHKRTTVAKDPSILTDQLLTIQSDNQQLKHQLKSLQDELKKSKAAVVRNAELKRRNDIPSDSVKLPDQHDVDLLLRSQRQRLDEQQQLIKQLQRQAFEAAQQAQSAIKVQRPKKRSTPSVVAANRNNSPRKPIDSFRLDLSSVNATSPPRTPKITTSRSQAEARQLAALSATLQERLDNSDLAAQPIHSPQDQHRQQEEMLAVRRELREKSAKIALLQQHFDHLASQVRAEKEIASHNARQNDELSQRLRNAIARERDLKRQLQSNDDSSMTLTSLQQIIDDLKSDKLQLEKQIQLLQLALFSGDSMENERTKQIITEASDDILKLQQQLRDKEAILTQFRQTLGESSDSLETKTKQFNDLQREHTETKAQLNEAKQRITQLSERLAIFSADSGIELEELQRALDIVRRQRENPSRVKFISNLDGSDADSNDMSVSGLSRRLSTMELQCKQLIVEVQQKSDLLTVQYEINREQKYAFDASKREIVNLTAEVEKLKYALQNSVAASGPENQQGLDSDSIFALSENESELSLDPESNENLIAIRVNSARLNRHSAHFSSSSQLTSGSPPLTFLTSDFFEFESSFSEIFSGLRPAFMFTTQYPVTIDASLLHYLETQSIAIRLHMQIHSSTQQQQHVHIGTAHIPCRELLNHRGGARGKAKFYSPEAEPNAKAQQLLEQKSSRVADNENDDAESNADSELIRARDAAGYIGEIEYVLRLKRPITSTHSTPESSRSTSRQDNETTRDNSDKNKSRSSSKKNQKSFARPRTALPSQPTTYVHADRNNKNKNKRHSTLHATAPTTQPRVLLHLQLRDDSATATSSSSSDESHDYVASVKQYNHNNIAAFQSTAASAARAPQQHSDSDVSRSSSPSDENHKHTDDVRAATGHSISSSQQRQNLRLSLNDTLTLNPEPLTVMLTMSVHACSIGQFGSVHLLHLYCKSRELHIDEAAVKVESQPHLQQQQLRRGSDSSSDDQSSEAIFVCEFTTHKKLTDVGKHNLHIAIREQQPASAATAAAAAAQPGNRLDSLVASTSTPAFSPFTPQFKVYTAQTGKQGQVITDDAAAAPVISDVIGEFEVSLSVLAQRSEGNVDSRFYAISAPGNVEQKIGSIQYALQWRAVESHAMQRNGSSLSIDNQ